jgi:hypothetical protein
MRTSVHNFANRVADPDLRDRFRILNYMLCYNIYRVGGNEHHEQIEILIENNFCFNR